MEATYEFALSGELIDFTLHHILEGCPTPPNLFKEVMAEKCQLVNHHFLNTRDHLRIAANVSSMATTIAFHDTIIADSKLTIVTITNTPDLEKQLVQLWCEVQQVLKHYNEEDRISEMASIESYYRNFEYKKLMAQMYNYEFY